MKNSQEIEGFRLSYQQERIISLLRQGHSLRSQLAVVIEGVRDCELLNGILRRLLEKHEIYRTKFLLTPENNIQIAGLSLAGTIATVSDGSLNCETRDSAVFEPSEASDHNNIEDDLIRVKIARLSENSLLLGIDISTLVADRHSLYRLYNELGHNLAEAMKAKTLAGREETESYFKYAEWARQMELDPGSVEGLAFWKNRVASLAKMSSPFLPCEDPCLSTQTYRFVTAASSPQLFAMMRQCASTYSVSHDSILFACWRALLCRLSGESEFAVGFGADGRVFAELEKIAGPFFQFLPELSTITLSDTPAQTISRLAQDLDLLQGMQELYPVVSNECLIKDKLVFMFETGSAFESYTVGDLTIACLKEYCCNEPFKLRMKIVNGNESHSIQLHYNAQLYREDDVSSILSQYIHLVGEACSQPNTQWKCLNLTGATDVYEIKRICNPSSIDCSNQKTICDLFDAIVHEAPDRVAVVWKESAISYRKLDSSAAAVAKKLRSNGIGNGDVVGVYMQRSPKFIIAIIGVIKAGAAYVPLDLAWPEQRLMHIVNDAHVKVVVTEGDGLRKILEKNTCVLDIQYLDNENSEDGLSHDAFQPRVFAESLAYIIYTSGSTGKPKGVMVTHGALANLACWQRARFDINERSRISLFSSFTFDASVGEMAMALLNGATLVLLDRENIDPEELTQYINNESLSIFLSTPAMLGEFDPSRFKGRLTVVCVGEECPPVLADRFQPFAHFINAYGPTEYTVYSHSWDVPERHDYSRLPIGIPILNTHGTVQNSFRAATIGQIGEIALAGAGLARGYLNDPKTTAEKFIPIPDSEKYYNDVSIEGTLDFASDQIIRFEIKERERLLIERAGTGMEAPVKVNDVELLLGGFDEDIKSRVKNYISEYSFKTYAWNAFQRYFVEGLRESYGYAGINREILTHLIGTGDWTGMKIADFGCGSGEVLRILARFGATAVGYDICPFFVQRLRSEGLDARVAKVDEGIDDFNTEFGCEAETFDFSISTLLLDRVENPRELMKNMLRSLKPHGRFAIQTLLPVLPSDDGKVENPFTYTDRRNQIAFSGNDESDLAELVEFLRLIGGERIVVARIPYCVRCGRDLQKYLMWSLSGFKVKSSRDQEQCNLDGRRMYLTGDRGFINARGLLMFRGRVDNQIKLRGFRVELGEIEACIRKAFNGEDCVALAHKTTNGHQQITVYLPAGSSLSKHETSELKERLAEYLPEYMIPSEFRIIENIPLNSSGKVDRNALLQLAASQIHGKKGVLPTTPDQALLMDIWKSILPVKEFGISDKFFEIGGDSIMSIQIVAKAREAGLPLRPVDILEYQTIEKIVEALPKDRKTLLNQVCCSDEVIPTPIQRWFYQQDRTDFNSYGHAVTLTLDKAAEKNPILEMERLAQFLLTQHDVLRLSIEKKGTAFVQKVQPTAPGDIFQYVDLGEISRIESKVVSRLRKDLEASLDIEKGIMLRGAIIKSNVDREILIMLVVHHLCADLISWKFLLEDMTIGYNQMAKGIPIFLPPQGASYQDFAFRLNQYAGHEAVKDDADYWAAMLENITEADPFPTKSKSEGCLREKMSIVLDVETTSLLAGKARNILKAETSVLILAIVAKSISDWIGHRHILLDIEEDGRHVLPSSVDYSRTMGWFTYVYPILVDMNGEDSPIQWVEAIRNILRDVSKRAINFGLLRYGQTTEFNNLGSAQISFNYTGDWNRLMPQSGGFSLVKELTGYFGDDISGWPYALSINSGIADDRLWIDWLYDGKRISRDSIEHLSKECLFNARRAAQVSDMDKDSARLVGLGLTNELLKDIEWQTEAPEEKSLEK